MNDTEILSNIINKLSQYQEFKAEMISFFLETDLAKVNLKCHMSYSQVT